MRFEVERWRQINFFGSAGLYGDYRYMKSARPNLPRPPLDRGVLLYPVLILIMPVRAVRSLCAPTDAPFVSVIPRIERKNAFSFLIFLLLPLLLLFFSSALVPTAPLVGSIRRLKRGLKVARSTGPSSLTRYGSGGGKVCSEVVTTALTVHCP